MPKEIKKNVDDLLAFGYYAAIFRMLMTAPQEINRALGLHGFVAFQQ
jgi:hypothetical protein